MKMSINQLNIKLTYNREVNKDKSWFIKILIIYMG